MADVAFSIPVLSLSGRIGNSQMGFYASKGRAFVRAFTPAAQPNSPDQAAVRAFLTASARQWTLLTDAQRAAWTAYAANYFTDEVNGTLVTPSGAQIYNKVAFYRQAQGLALPTAAPAAAPPAPLSGFVNQPVGDLDTFRFVVSHAISVVTGFELVARISPAMPGARTPRDADLRYIKGVAAISFISLPEDNEDAIWNSARFSIEETKRFRAELTIVNPDGVPSRPLAANFTRTVV
jgi:hypothetical protein